MTKQVEIRRATYRIVSETPSHLTIGIWVNGGKAGDLTIRQEERSGVFHLLNRGGFLHWTLDLAPDRPR